MPLPVQFAILLVVFLQAQIWQHIRGIQLHVVLNDKGRQQFLAMPTNDTLYCFVCNFEADGRKCKDLNNTNVDIVSCPRDHKCQVWHFYSLGTKYTENAEETFYFDRKCTKDCNEGIVPLDDMGNRFVSHTSCCTESYCNAGNSAMPQTKPQGQFTISLTGLTILLFLIIPNGSDAT